MMGFALLSFVRRHWSTLAVVALVVGLSTGAYLRGSSNATTRVTARYEAVLAERDRVAAQAMAQALEKARAQAVTAMVAERTHLQAQAKAEQQFRTITKTVTEYVDKTPGLDACMLDRVGLCLWNAANGGGGDPAACHP